MIANSRFHRWRYAQGFVNPAKVVVQVMKRDCVLKIRQLFAECVGQASESAHRHTHRQILAFNVAGRNVVVIGVADNANLPLELCRWLRRRSHRDGPFVARKGRPDCT